MLSPDHISALLVLADVYVGQGRAADAATLLEGVHAMAPDDPAVIKALCYASLVAGQNERALSSVERFLALGQDLASNAAVLLIQTRALWELGRHEEAHRSLQRYRQVSATS